MQVNRNKVMRKLWPPLVTFRVDATKKRRPLHKTCLNYSLNTNIWHPKYVSSEKCRIPWYRRCRFIIEQCSLKLSESSSESTECSLKLTECSLLYEAIVATSEECDIKLEDSILNSIVCSQFIYLSPPRGRPQPTGSNGLILIVITYWQYVIEGSDEELINVARGFESCWGCSILFVF
jgi:hypothetical protein